MTAVRQKKAVCETFATEETVAEERTAEDEDEETVHEARMKLVERTPVPERW